MSETRLSAVVDERGLARAIATALQELIATPPDALTLFEDGCASPDENARWRIDAYFTQAPDADVLQTELAQVLGCDIPEFKAEAVPDENWVALSQAALPPVFAGRFVVHGSHDRHRIARGPNAIEIEAGEAFGTAHHATTYGCLEAIDKLTRQRAYRDVLDLGCGSGVLAIAVARVLPHARILASDIDATSVCVARQNIRHNGAGPRIHCAVAKGFNHQLRRRHFDLVIANILAGPLIGLAAEMARHCRPRGTLVLSGILNDQSAQVIAAYRAAGFTVRNRIAINGWSTLTLQRCSSPQVIAGRSVAA